MTVVGVGGRFVVLVGRTLRVEKVEGRRAKQIIAGLCFFIDFCGGKEPRGAHWIVFFCVKNVENYNFFLINL